MHFFRPKHTIAVFETNSKTSAQFVGNALQNGHRVVALGNQNKTFTEAKKFSVANTLDELLVKADVVVIAGGAEHHQAAHHAVKRVAAYVEANTVHGYKFKHIYLVSAEGARPTAPLLERALYAELIHAEKDLVELVAKHVNIKYTVFRPPTLIETSKPNDVFVYDEAGEKTLTGLTNQISYSGLADAVLEIVETQPKFVNKVAGVNSKQVLVDALELRAIQTQSRKTASSVYEGLSEADIKHEYESNDNPTAPANRENNSDVVNIGIEGPSAARINRVLSEPPPEYDDHRPPGVDTVPILPEYRGRAE